MQRLIRSPRATCALPLCSSSPSLRLSDCTLLKYHKCVSFSHINSAGSGGAEVRPVTDSRVIVQSADLTGNCCSFLLVALWNEPFVGKVWRWESRATLKLCLIRNVASTLSVYSDLFDRFVFILGAHTNEICKVGPQTTTRRILSCIYYCSSFSSCLLYTAHWFASQKLFNHIHI